VARPLPPVPGRRRPLLAMPSGRNLLLGLGGLLAVNLLIVALVVGGRSDSGPPLPSEIESITPARGALIRPQEDVGVDLKDTYTGVILIDDHEIPEDQVTIRLGLGQVIFRPGEGKDIKVLRPGPHHATVEYWPQDKTRAEAGKSFTWQFTAG
jgi:hypothetical protein